MAETNKRSSARKRKQDGKARLLLFRAAAWFIVIGVVWTGYLLYRINGYDYNKEIPPADAGIVLGAALWDDVPSPALKERLDYAYELLESGKVHKLILTGGLDGNGSKLTEAEGMRNYLAALGVPEDKLLLELKARSTYENLLYSKPIVEAYQLNSLLLITHDYHAARASDIAHYLHYPQTTTAAFHTEVLSPVKNESREVLAFTKWELDKLLMTVHLKAD
ncbi:YdcF family protein [Paenibacillus protaetiae]|uniref:YdcF family protein n=2 Tax=Paenibacillus protaetiae TaxID=2509456 RepID=A0A4P6EZS0_9BACL|nr:YdcF family protein [Paenibacillus protaetiae]